MSRRSYDNHMALEALKHEEFDHEPVAREPLVMSTPAYLEAHPEVARHMVSLPGEQPWILDSGLVQAEAMLGWPQYAGGYIHWRLYDVREMRGWEKYAATPYRIYLCDYDDWDRECLYETEEEARAVLALLLTGPVHARDLKELGFRG